MLFDEVIVCIDCSVEECLMILFIRVMYIEKCIVFIVVYWLIIVCCCDVIVVIDKGCIVEYGSYE